MGKRKRECCVCENTEASCHESILFHRFPTNPYLRPTWIKLLNINCYIDDPNKVHVCSQHFQPSDYYVRNNRRVLKRKVVPSLNLGACDDKCPDTSTNNVQIEDTLQNVVVLDNYECQDKITTAPVQTENTLVEKDRNVSHELASQSNVFVMENSSRERPVCTEEKSSSIQLDDSTMGQSTSAQREVGSNFPRTPWRKREVFLGDIDVHKVFPTPIKSSRHRKEGMRKYIASKRQDVEFKEVENVTNKERIERLRKDVEFKEEENVINKKRIERLRKDVEFKEEENVRNKERIERLRKDVEFKEEENVKNRERIQGFRKDHEFKEVENVKTRKRMREFRKKESVNDREAKKRKRENENCLEQENMETTQSKGRQQIAIKRNEDQIRQRNNIVKQYQRSNNTKAKYFLQFIKDRSCMPECICCCCEGLFFNHSVVSFNSNRIEETVSVFIYAKSINYNSEYICKTCHSAVIKGKVPKLSTSNGLKFVDIPICLQILSPLEERMVSPYINFMQIRALKSYAVHPQLGLKGSIVNIPIEINDMLNVLPRNFDQMATLQLKLKRHLEHKSHYMYETIRPAAVCDALKYLIETPLYKKYSIQVDSNYVYQFQNMYEKQVEFIIDHNDMYEDRMTCNSQNDLSILQDIDFDSDFELEEEYNEEVMLIDRNEEMVNQVRIIAPGQGKIPVPWHAVEDIDELCFPKIFAGHKMNIPSFISYSDRAKSEVRRWDRRSCTPSRLFFLAKKKLEKSCLGSLNICLRKTKRNKDVKVKNVLDAAFLDNMFKLDQGHKILKQIRSSPSYWEARKRDLMATIRQLGKPTIFLTLSAGEKIWPELLQCLSKLNLGKTITIDQALSLEDAEKAELISRDPVTCARYFDFKTNKLMLLLKRDNSVFEEYTVEDSYERVEFQLRGSPHEHIFLWIKDAPKYDPFNSKCIDECIRFIDRFITCEYDENDVFMGIQRHRHSHTCYKGTKNKKKCRFNYPLPVMNRTMILEPLNTDDRTDEITRNMTKIRDLMYHYSKKQELVSFEDILVKLNMTEDQYILALRSSLKRAQVFLKRSSLEVNINSYNRTILHLFEANIDVQFVVEEYGVASYIINYVGKVDAGLSKLLRDAEADANNGNLGVKEKFRKITNVFLNSNLLSAQEAAYHVLSLPLSKSSRQTLYINTSPIDERVLMLKSHAELRKLCADSTEIFAENDINRYAARSLRMENKCLADFVSSYSKRKIKNNDNDDEIVEYRPKNKIAVIRYRRYKLDQDQYNYYREQIMLFMPWRNEIKEVETVNTESVYNQNLGTIEENRKKYSIIDDGLLDQALENAQNEILDVEEEEINIALADELSSHQKVDILQQEGSEIPKDKFINRFVCPKRVSNEEIQNAMYSLNNLQREFVMHVLHCFKTQKLPLKIFLNGSAGVGKSTVIRCLYQMITSYHDNLPGVEKDKLVVLLCAPSGKAAYLINGVTLHTAFALPVAQFGGQMPELSADLANNIREKLFHLKLLIIDEISMVGSTLLNRVDTRLRQIRGINKPFGDLSIIAVGDLNQLPPVMDSPIYKPSRNNEMFRLFDVNPLWEEFQFFELEQIMRQKDEKHFIEALNNLAIGQMSTQDIELFKSREVQESDVPESAIRLYGENVNVENYNKLKIEKQIGSEYISEAKDIILGKVSDASRQKVLESLKTKNVTETNGLPYRVRFKLNIKYMITSNINVEDGLVNGACGCLKHITFCPNTTDPYIVWLDFASSVVGKKAQLPYRDYMKNENVSSNLTPIAKIGIPLNISYKLQFQILRKQFPLVPAEAITIHKSQGQTYKEACVDFNKSKRLTRAMLYVALSRVTNLSGLYILGTFKPPKMVKFDDPVLSELSRLRTQKK